MEQISEYRVYLDNTYTPIQILKQALSVFQVTQSLLVALVLLIHTEKFKGVLEKRTAEKAVKQR